MNHSKCLLNWNILCKKSWSPCTPSKTPRQPPQSSLPLSRNHLGWWAWLNSFPSQSRVGQSPLPWEMNAVARQFPNVRLKHLREFEKLPIYKQHWKVKIIRFIRSSNCFFSAKHFRNTLYRKKIQACEMLGKSRILVLFLWVVGLEGRKVGSLKQTWSASKKLVWELGPTFSQIICVYLQRGPLLRQHRPQTVETWDLMELSAWSLGLNCSSKLIAYF